MEKCTRNKNASAIKTSLVDTGVDEDISSLVASTLVSSTKDIGTGSSTGNCHIDNGTVHRSRPIRKIIMEDDVCYD